MKTKGVALCFQTVGLLAAGTACAQPPVKSETAVNPPNWGQPAARRWDAADMRSIHATTLSTMGPAAVADYFVFAVARQDWEAAGACVAGNAYGAPAVATMKQFVRETNQKRWRTDRAMLEEDKRIAALTFPEGATLEVNVSVMTDDDLGVELRSNELVKFRREKITWPKGLAHDAGERQSWRIVAPVLNEVKTGRTPLGAIGMYALLLSDADYAFTFAGSNRSLNQAKYLGLGLMQFLQDYDEKFQLDPANWKEKLSPYVQTEQLFTAPGDRRGVLSYSFNPKLAGRLYVDVKNPAKTVLLYLGKEGKLDYRYRGGATVAFADGHVQLVREGEILNWEP